MKRIAFLGSGALATELSKNVREWNLYEPVGYFDGSIEKGTIIDGLPILGDDGDVVEQFNKGLFEYLFIAVGYLKFQVRENLYNRFKGIVPFANIISPTSNVHPTAILGEGVLLSDGVFIHRQAVIEDNVMITLRSIVNHGGVVKKHTFFSTGVITAGNIVVGERCFIGVGVTISDGITICDDVWLSPGSIVIKNIKKPGHYLSQAAKLYNLG